jgi:hypothetical protein
MNVNAERAFLQNGEQRGTVRQRFALMAAVLCFLVIDSDRFKLNFTGTLDHPNSTSRSWGTSSCPNTSTRCSSLGRPKRPGKMMKGLKQRSARSFSIGNLQLGNPQTGLGRAGGFTILKTLRSRR